MRALWFTILIVALTSGASCIAFHNGPYVTSYLSDKNILSDELYFYRWRQDILMLFVSCYLSLDVS